MPDGQHIPARRLPCSCIAATGAIVCLAWAALLASYRKLNHAKLEVLQDLERDLPVSPFAHEQAVYRAEGRRSLARIERWVPGCFFLLHAAMLAAAALR